ncbi:D-alanyl-D-alanine carboxypeptidase [Clostridium sp. chh4-2]|uniref:serine hydrolase n=1 Tax=Clostridium sp. chh4-2 TaxID=2067550 RepID=UPI000CCF62D8|nr:serine hydrolase [Clostridium sp. chh4-2]PNV61515.1 D-alanyl-D-alanine carboxypeptidase [Clostridium sp. chh4-2]
MKKFLTMLLCLCLLAGLFPLTAFAAPEWTENVSIEAEGGIVIDANTGAVIYGKNMHQTYFPASITKILTALLVIENCDLDETVTFSQNAVYNVESGSSNMSMETGDQLSVRDCLYGLMLQSANEVANALAEHVAGTTEDFAVMMNEKAASLGCVDSHFANPSGLNDPDHYTSAYDMALISKAAFENPTFVEIDSTTYYEIPETKRNVGGRTIYAHHSMLKKNDSRYYPGVIGGKTGYTSLAGNTLVTCAQRDDMKLISVILNGHQTHYADTKALLDFGFENFQSLRIAEHETTFTSLENDMTIAGLPSSNLNAISIDKDARITLPKSAAFSDAVSDISFDITTKDPENAIAKVLYNYDGRSVGTAYLMVDRAMMSAPAPAPAQESASEPASTAAVQEPETQPIVVTTPAATDPKPDVKPAKEPKTFAIPSVVWKVLAVIAVLAVIIGLIAVIRVYQERKEEQARLIRRQKRLKRFKDAGYSATEFDMLLEQKRSSYTTKRKNHRRKKFPFFK